MTGDEGDDALWGYEGNDRIEGGSGNDSLVGGPDDDIITDSFGDDTIHGDRGNDAIHVGPGLDIAFGGLGDDFVVNGSGDASQFFLGMGDDVVLGTTGRMTVFGGEQNDWVEGGSHADLLQGDNADQYQNDTLGGSDVVIGGLGNDDIEGEGGDDILVGSAVGTDRHLGNLGFDWLTYYGQTADVTSDWAFTLLAEPNNPLPSRFDQLEALSGGAGSDTLRGPLVVPDDVAASEIPLQRATEESIALIDGLDSLLRPEGATFDYAAPLLRDTPNADANGVGMIIIGGPGDDTVEGRPGDDFLDGDAQLRVQLVDTTSGERFDSAAQLRDRVFDGTVNPGDIDIVREIVMDPDADGSNDTSVYGDEMAAYTITQLSEGYWQVSNSGAADPATGDGSDVIRGFERLQFSDGCAELNGAGDAWESCSDQTVISEPLAVPAADEPVIATLDAPAAPAEATTGATITWEGDAATPTVGQLLLGTPVSTGDELDGIEFTYVWTRSSDPAVPPSAEVLASTSAAYTTEVADVGQYIRVTAGYTDSAGTAQTVTAVTSAAVVGSTP